MELPMTASSISTSLAEPVISSLKRHFDELVGFPFSSLAIRFGAFGAGSRTDEMSEDDILSHSSAGAHRYQAATQSRLRTYRA